MLLCISPHEPFRNARQDAEHEELKYPIRRGTYQIGDCRQQPQSTGDPKTDCERLGKVRHPQLLASDPQPTAQNRKKLTGLLQAVDLTFDRLGCAANCRRLS